MSRVRLLALALLAAPATAVADGETFYFQVSNDLSPEQPVTTVTVFAAFDPRDRAFGLAEFDIVASEPNWFDLQALIDPIVPGGSVHPGVPTRTGERVEGALVFQDWLFGEPDPSNPIAIWQASFEVFDFSPREIDIWSEIERFEVITGFGGGPTPRHTFVDGQGAIRVVPAPGGALAMAVVAAVSLRRRRRSATRPMGGQGGTVDIRRSRR